MEFLDILLPCVNLVCSVIVLICVIKILKDRRTENEK